MPANLVAAIEKSCSSVKRPCLLGWADWYQTGAKIVESQNNGAVNLTDPFGLTPIGIRRP